MIFLDIFLNHLHIFKLSFDCFYIFQLQFGYFTSFLVCFVSLIEVDSLYYNYVSAFQLLLPFSESHQKPLPTDVYALQKTLWNFSFSLIPSITLVQPHSK